MVPSLFPLLYRQTGTGASASVKLFLIYPNSYATVICRMEIDITIRMALVKARDDRPGRCADIERETGVSQSILTRILKERQERLSEANWSRLYPVLAKYLPRDPRYVPPDRLAGWMARNYPDQPPADRLVHDGAISYSSLPPWLLELCRQWHALPDKAKAGVQMVAESALTQLESTPNPLPRVGAA